MIGRESKRSFKPMKSVTSEAALSRPFDSSILAKARAIAERYRVVLESDDKGGFVGRALEFPSGFERGRTADECVARLREALTAAVATMLEMGDRPPAASEFGVRQSQVNIRLTAEEKLLLESSAKQAGFRGLSDFLRARAIGGDSRAEHTRPVRPRAPKPRRRAAAR